MNITKSLIFAILASSLCIISCKEEKKEEIIIVKAEKPERKKSNQTIAMETQNSDFSVEWGGTNMYISITRSADSTLTKIKEEDIDGDTYFDNRVKLVIKRADGSEFFSQTFTKDRFRDFISKSQFNRYILYNFSHHDTTASTIDFVVNVGEPNESSDNYVNILLSINKQGVMSLKQFVLDETEGIIDDEYLEP